jgi:hypothetical protein
MESREEARCRQGPDILEVNPAVSFVSLEERQLSLEVKSRGCMEVVWWSVIGNLFLEVMVLTVFTMCLIVMQDLVVAGVVELAAW